MAERLFTRILVSVCLCSALVTLVLVPIPGDLPSPAFGQVTLYRLETALILFYGALLLVTPVFSGLFRGRLPIEISTRGAKFADEADRSGEQTAAAIEQLEQTTNRLANDLAAAELEINQLKEGAVTVDD
jgi:hypothetical protein